MILKEKKYALIRVKILYNINLEQTKFTNKCRILCGDILLNILGVKISQYFGLQNKYFWKKHIYINMPINE